jgi:glycosyltransferase involved in cell wall biosynthesis
MLPEQQQQHAVIERVMAPRPIVCFANDMNGDPTSKHHVMRTYAQHTDVVWVESSGMRRPQLSNPLDLQRIAMRIRRSAGGARAESVTVSGRLRVLSPLSIPLPGNPVATAINGALYRRATRRSLGELNTAKDPLLWVYIPTTAPYLPPMRRHAMVYHCVDRWWEFTEYNPPLMRRYHEQLCRQADVVFASATALLEDCRPYTDKAYLIPHGVEWDHFAAAAFTPPERPADVADIQGPVIGFFGLVHDWVDQDLLVRVARANPEATVVMIGRCTVDVSRLRAEPNIRLVGQKKYAELPAYSAMFDVALIPFVFNELTAAVNPIKLREYLSAGMPVVATALPDIRLLAGNPMLRAVESSDEFVQAVGDFLTRPLTAEARQAAALRMVPESWLGRCAEMSRLLEQHTA